MPLDFHEGFGVGILTKARILTQLIPSDLALEISSAGADNFSTLKDFPKNKIDQSNQLPPSLSRIFGSYSSDQNPNSTFSLSLSACAMTTYGTIPMSSAAASGPTTSSPFDYIHRAKARGASALATRRPWRELADPSSFGLPPSLGEAYLRLRKNLVYFAMNYAIIILLIVFLSLLWHPISLIVFIVTMVAWLFFYFLKDEPLVLFGREIADSVILLVLAVVTLILLLLTNATVNILVSLLIGIVVVVAHASLRKAEEMYMDEEAAGGGRWYASVSEVVSKTAGTSRY